MEVVYDLDYEARHLCDTLGLHMVRARTPGTHPRFITMLRELILERTAGAERRWSGQLGPGPTCALPVVVPQCHRSAVVGRLGCSVPLAEGEAISGLSSQW